MKLGYRERVALLIVLVLAIFALGIFAFIRPQWKKLAENQKKLETAKNDWNAQLITFETINDMRKTIVERRDKAYNISQIFTDEMDALELDKFMAETFLSSEKLREDKVGVRGTVTITSETTTTLGYYYYTPSVVTYPLFTVADFDGSIEKAVQEKLKEATVLGERNAETVGCGNFELTLQINRENAFEFVDAVYDYAKKHNDAMLIQSVEFKECDFNGEVEGDENAPTGEGAEGEAPQTPTTNNKKDDNVIPGYTEVTFKYQVFYMQEPTEVKEKIGPEYNPAIWDGKEWKTYTSRYVTVETTSAK